MTIDELKDRLHDAGWRVATRNRAEPGDTDWTAWRPLAGVPDCAHNGKPPSFSIDPYDFAFRNGVRASGVEFDVRGMLPGGHWVTFKVYAVPIDQMFDTAPHAERILAAAWRAAHEDGGEK